MGRASWTLIAALLVAACTGGSMGTEREPGPGPRPRDDAGPEVDAGPGPDPDPQPDAGLPPPSAACLEAADAVVAMFRAGITSSGTPGGAVAIVCGGEIVRAEGVGVIAAGGAPVTPQTLFQMASVTKSFTAATIMTLVDDGMIRLDEPIETYVPFANSRAPYPRGATVAEFLAHSAGYPTAPVNEGTPASDTLDAWVRSLAGEQLWSPPGEVFNYSNPGFSFAGLAAERAGGMPFGPLVESRLFGPAGMTRATMDSRRVAADPDHATGHSGSGAASAMTIGPLQSYYDTSWYGPMGGAWCSIEDLARFGMLLSGAIPGVISEASRQAMVTPQVNTGSPSAYWGLGLSVTLGTTGVNVGHGGSVGGFLTSYAVLPEQGIGVFTMVNGDWWFGGEIEYDALAMLAPDWSYAPDPDFREADRAMRTGTYQGVMHGRVDVRDAAGGGIELVFVDRGSRVAPVMEPYPEAYYFVDPFDGYDTGLTFWPDPSGRPRHISSLSFVASR